MLSTSPTHIDNDIELKSTRFIRERAVSLFIGAAASSERTVLENFIARGFSQRYHANITAFMPLLIGLGNQMPCAGVGVRRATSPLFVERYMPVPVEELLKQVNLFTPRDSIAEIGNLYSRSARYTKPLLLAAALGLDQCGVDTLVFTATCQIRELMASSGVTLTYLCDAPAACMNSEREAWGTYYEARPHVVALRINEVIKHVSCSAQLVELIQSTAPYMHRVTQAMGVTL